MSLYILVWKVPCLLSAGRAPHYNQPPHQKTGRQPVFEKHLPSEKKVTVFEGLLSLEKDNKEGSDLEIRIQLYVSFYDHLKIFLLLFQIHLVGLPF